jgi:sugar fermentation stimulation protein A
MMAAGEIITGRFIKRPNRFLGIVEVNDEATEVYVPNPGRMHELLVPGKRVYLRKRDGSHRKTSYDMIGLKYAGVTVSIDANLPNRFVKQSLLNCELEWFKGYDSVTAEPRAYEGRFDFKLEGDSGLTFIEVKSCTLVEEGRAIFPDAPTERGARHLRHLADSLHDGTAQRAVVMFVIQRPDAKVWSPNDLTDSKFGDALRLAHERGVEILPITTRVVDWQLELVSSIPYELNHFISEVL